MQYEACRRTCIPPVHYKHINIFVSLPKPKFQTKTISKSSLSNSEIILLLSPSINQSIKFDLLFTG